MSVSADRRCSPCADSYHEPTARSLPRNNRCSAAAIRCAAIAPAIAPATTSPALTAEVRYPLTSPLNVGRFGVKGFVDAGTIWASGERLADQPFQRGIGGGVFFGAAVFMFNFDLGWPEDGKPRGHFGIGVSF